jgi:hypothetical protein
MKIYHILQIGQNFYYNHTYLALAILASLLILALLNPKATFKVAVASLILAVVIYFASLLGQSSIKVMDSKKEMINQSRN